MNTCRLCKKWDRQGEMVKYSTRHYAHGSCAIAKWGKDILTKIPAPQLKQLPFLALREAGLLEAVEDFCSEWDRTTEERMAAFRAKLAETPSK